jgi:DNA-binding HxlR family transcriptional regulator
MMDWAGAQLTVSLVSGKWDIRVLAALEQGPKRYNELSRRVGMRHKVLTETLQRLECIGLIGRHVSAASPPEVRYELTPLACSLADLLTPLGHWARDNWETLTVARAAQSHRTAPGTERASVDISRS